MKITCTKLFEDYDQAKEFCLAHVGNYAKMYRADPKTQAMLETTASWEVKWYEYQTARKEDEKTTFERFDQNSPAPIYLGRVAKRYSDDYETSRGFGLI